MSRFLYLNDNSYQFDNGYLWESVVNASRLLKLSVAVSAISAGWSAQAAGQSLETLVVQGDLFEGVTAEAVFDHPGGRTLLDSDEVAVKGADNVRDALKGVPGVFTPTLKGTGSAESGLSIGVRGLPARLSPRTYVLVDGQPLSYAPYGQPQLSFAPLSLAHVARIDVMRNGGAVRYGPNNPGGTINFETHSIPQSFEGNLSASTSIWGSGRQQGNAGPNKVNLRLGDTLDSGLGLMLMYAGNRGSSYRAHSDYNIDDLMLKYHYDLSEDWALNGRLQHYNADGEIPGGLTQAQFDEDPYQSTRPFDQASGRRNGGMVTLRWTPDTQQEFELTGSYNETFRQFVLARSTTDTLPLRLRTYPRNYRQYSLEPRYSRAWGNSDLSGEWSVGYRYSNETAHEQRYQASGVNLGDNPPLGSLQENAHSTVEAHAVYADNRFEWGNWTLTPGVRYEYVEESRRDDVKGIADAQVDFREWLPSLNALYRLSGDTNLYASWNTTFAPIQFRQLQDVTTLEPEKAQNFDLGVRTRQGALQLEAGLFYIDFDDMIEYDSAQANYFNTGRATYKGVELSARYGLAVPGASLFLSYTWLDAEYEEGLNAGNQVAFTSEHMISTGLDYESGPHQWRLTVQGQSDQFADDANTEAPTADGKKGRVPGSVTADISYGYQAGPDLRLSAGIHNLLDREAYSRSKDLNGGLYLTEPRHLALAVSYDF